MSAGNFLDSDTMMRGIIVLVVLLCITSITCGQADGWKMIDRFFGFRFEMGGDQLDNSVLEQVQAHADQQSCFGWIQKSKSFNFVGEVYTDTKIRLHFSHFKILDAERETCFLDKPHQCIESPPAHEAASSSSSSRNEF